MGLEDLQEFLVSCKTQGRPYNSCPQQSSRELQTQQLSLSSPGELFAGFLPHERDPCCVPTKRRAPGPALCFVSTPLWG